MPTLRNRRATRLALSLALAWALAACSGSITDPLGLKDSGGSGGSASTADTVVKSPEGANGPVSSTAGLSGAELPADQQLQMLDASRFLTQATFGPTSFVEVSDLMKYGYSAWFNHQLALPTPGYLDYVDTQAVRKSSGKPDEVMAYEAFWQQWLYSPAQLRARVAFALSEIFVISNVAPDLDPRAMASYMDMLNRNAFGNYRKLLEDVTLHPAMGYYLNMLGSEKEDPEKGVHPNENYAREVLQLFSIGLVQLNPDGTTRLDAEGKPIPTYDESVVKGFARAFSGWGFGGKDTTKNSTFGGETGDWTIPMQPWASKHSTASKTLLNGHVIPAGQTPADDMRQALDVIAAHPNVGPFIARRLIQRLVTSNPSPAYVNRVAAAFDNDGKGSRGALSTVVYAVLMDPEARSADAFLAPNYGKQREPVIRFANFLRALNARSDSGHSEIWNLDSADNSLGQSPMLSPSVFNFFSPDFRNPGPIAQAGLYSPEFQITNEASVVGNLNFFANLIRNGGHGSNANRLRLDFSALESVADDAKTMLDAINVLFMNGTMTTATRTSMMRAVNSIDPRSRTDRVKSALILTSIAPEFVIQR
jgi:uncharacterized protein (DUF1800 family)